MSGTVSTHLNQMQIGNFNLKDKVLIVAEIGNNHEGKLNIAKDLVRKASECGVDAVKFQTFQTERYVSRSDAGRFQQLKSFELSDAQFAELSRLAHSLDLLFISTPLDLTSAEFLEGMVDAYKISSGDNNFYPLIAQVVKTGKPVIISSGASDQRQVARTVAFVKDLWGKHPRECQLTILHCVSSYPVPQEEANLGAIKFLSEKFDVPVGYSDHTVGLEASLVAVAVGARIIEKHFTLDKHFSNFRDHHLSADPDEMKELVRRVRAVTLMLGSGEKVIQSCEKPNAGAIRRSIVAATDLPEGHRLLWSDLMWIRPAGGLAPGEEHLLIGKTLKRNVQLGEQLLVSNLK